MNPAEEEDEDLTVTDPTGTALEWKDRGNDHFAEKDYAKAVEAYESGLEALNDNNNNNNNNISGSGNGSGGDVSTAIALRSNLAMVLIKLEDFHRAEQECSSILKEDPENTKG
jgi:tetratricopeptide (TPR) repeat protein